ncbi:Dps family protein [Pseudocnuella soli]|uniref:Dps family protein n=1 Tax=Pseudocnuella soli TaxID=2502779 RepID=UPI001044DC24|nr:DNA starvation/stationary phase protection protein [Pseudocnuella soli]
MAQINQIGLDTQQSGQLSEKLNVLLANLQVFYINARGLHWNITGDKFFELHVKFEELYNDLLLKVDEVAERILTLGNTPAHSFTQYLQQSHIKEATNIADATTAVQTIVANLQTLLTVERDILHLAGEAGDEGTSALMSDYIRQQEKMVWMYGAFLK